MKLKCEVCHREFEARYMMRVCDDCYTELIKRIESPEHGICPVCGKYSDAIARNPKKKFCGTRCHDIGHNLMSRKYRKDNAEQIQEKRKKRRERRTAGIHRKLDAQHRIDAIAMIGRARNKSYGWTRVLLQQRADREGISLDMAIEAVQQEQGLQSPHTEADDYRLLHASYVDHDGNVVFVD